MAQFSLRYSLASIILRRRLGLTDFTAAAVFDPRIVDISRVITLRTDETLTGSYAPARVEVRTLDGRQLTKTVTALHGSSELPLTAAAIEQKLSDCATWPSRKLDIEKLRASIEVLDEEGAAFSICLG